MGDPIFAAYLSHLDKWGDVQDRGLFDAMWVSLRSALRQELKRRNLWRLSPGFLGLYGWEYWSEGALDDLTHDCYLFAIHERRRALLAQWRNQHDIYGLILRNIRSYLFETQRRHDPIGFRVFELLQLTARDLLDSGELYLIFGAPKVRNETIMEFTSIDPTPEPILQADSAGLRDATLLWCDRLLPDLVTARGHAVKDLRHRLRDCFLAMPAAGIARFRFGDLVDVVKKETRRRWTAITSQELADPSVVDSLGPGPLSERQQTEQYRSLLQHLEHSIETFSGRHVTKEYLRRLLTYLRHHAADTDSPTDLPSARRMAEILQIPRERLRGLFLTLQQFAEQRTASVVAEGWPGPRVSSVPFQERASP